MAADDVARRAIKGQGEQLPNNALRDENGVSAAAFETRHNDGSHRRSAKGGYGFLVNRRVVEREEEDAFGVFQKFQTGLKRTEHAAFRVLIDGLKNARVDGLADGAGIMPENHDEGVGVGEKDPLQAAEEGFILKLEQRFWPAHAAGSATGQNQTGNHFNSALSFSLVKMDFDSAFQSLDGARRTAIISATTETAISSGVMAPISSPMGAKIRSNCSRRKPSC